MEVMIVNVVNSAFDTVTYVELGIEVLDAFMHLNTREVRRLKYIIADILKFICFIVNSSYT